MDYMLSTITQMGSELSIKEMWFTDHYLSIAMAIVIVWIGATVALYVASRISDDFNEDYYRTMLTYGGFFVLAVAMYLVYTWYGYYLDTIRYDELCESYRAIYGPLPWEV